MGRPSLPFHLLHVGGQVLGRWALRLVESHGLRRPARAPFWPRRARRRREYPGELSHSPRRAGARLLGRLAAGTHGKLPARQSARLLRTVKQHRLRSRQYVGILLLLPRQPYQSSGASDRTAKNRRPAPRARRRIARARLVSPLARDDAVPTR